MVEIDLDFLKHCLRTTGQLALSQRGQMVADVKADRSPVTVVDRQVEDALIEQIQAHYPGHIILSEETGLRPGAAEAEISWIIDPIDGTRAFASGLPIWGVSIGVFKAGKPHAGGFYMPVTDEIYWGTTEEAYYNNHRLKPVESIDLDSPLVFLGVPSNFHMHFKISYPRIRSLGSTAAQLIYVATGAAVGELTRSIGLWDVAGVLPLLQAVGIELAYLSGKPIDTAALMDGQPIREPMLAAHPSVMDQLRKQIIE